MWLIQIDLVGYADLDHLDSQVQVCLANFPVLAPAFASSSCLHHLLSSL